MAINAPLHRILLGLLALCIAMGHASPASAQSIATSDTRHPSYKLELEPHLSLGWLRPPGDSWGVGGGGGLRVAIPVADRGLIEGVNDTVAISFGFDVVHHSAGGLAAGECAEYRGNGNERICVRVASAGGPSSYVLLPVMFQWNFFLTDAWSVFGEPGLGTYLQLRERDGTSAFGFYPVFMAGGRYHFSKHATLTMRAGYPHLTVGLSFLF